MDFDLTTMARKTAAVVVRSKSIPGARPHGD
jgi:hypothetical protein